MVQVVLGLGSNLGDRESWLSKARDEISDKLGEILICSDFVESAPWGFSSDNSFLNQVILIDSNLSASKLLDVIHLIESDLGRVRKDHYADRKVDIDILFFGDIIMETENLSIPHPHIQNRLFVLKPLAQILPDLKHPVLGVNISQLLEKCKDNSACEFLSDRD